VNDQRVAVIETEQLVLSSSLDRSNAPALGRPRARWRKLAFESRMDRPHRGDRFPKGGTAQRAGGALDFG
jgi:hypothetical protein